MTVEQFVQTAGAVVFGNLLSAVFIYALWRIRHAERTLGVKDGSTVLPIWVTLLLLPALVVVGAAAYLLD